MATIDQQRRRLEDHLNDNPSLKLALTEAVEKTHHYALAELLRVIRFEKKDLPNTCPYNVEQIFAPDFYPE